MLGFEEAIGTAVGILLGLALLKYSGYVDAAKKELGYLASGAVFMLVASVVNSATVAETIQLGNVLNWISLIFIVIAFILVLIGAITMAIQIFSKLR